MTILKCPTCKVSSIFISQESDNRRRYIPKCECGENITLSANLEYMMIIDSKVVKVLSDNKWFADRFKADTREKRFYLFSETQKYLTYREGDKKSVSAGQRYKPERIGGEDTLRVLTMISQYISGKKKEATVAELLLLTEESCAILSISDETYEEEK